MLTLTIDPKKMLKTVVDESCNGETLAAQAHDYLMRVWKKFRARMWKGQVDSSGRVRVYRFKYLAVVEWDKNHTRPHMHILIDRFLPASIVRRFWSESGGGMQIDFSYIPSNARSKKALLYVLKYISKTLSEGIRGCRRWMASKGVLPVQEPKDSQGEYVPVTRTEVKKMNREEVVVLYGDETGEEMVLYRGQLDEVESILLDGLADYIDHLVETDAGGCNNDR